MKLHEHVLWLKVQTRRLSTKYWNKYCNISLFKKSEDSKQKQSLTNWPDAITEKPINSWRYKKKGILLAWLIPSFCGALVHHQLHRGLKSRDVRVLITVVNQTQSHSSVAQLKIFPCSRSSQTRRRKKSSLCVLMFAASSVDTDMTVINYEECRFRLKESVLQSRKGLQQTSYHKQQQQNLFLGFCHQSCLGFRRDRTNPHPIKKCLRSFVWLVCLFFWNVKTQTAKIFVSL